MCFTYWVDYICVCMYTYICIYVYITYNIYISESHLVMSDSLRHRGLYIQCMEFSRPEYWSGQPFPSLGDLPSLGIEPRSPVLKADSLSAEPQGKPDFLKADAFKFLIFNQSICPFFPFILSGFCGIFPCLKAKKIVNLHSLHKTIQLKKTI